MTETVTETVTIRTEYIRLQDLLKYAGAAGTGGEAKAAIQAGEAAVNGSECRERGRKLRPGDTAAFRGKTYQVAYSAASSGAGSAADGTAENAENAENRDGGSVREAPGGADG